MGGGASRVFAGALVFGVVVAGAGGAVAWEAGPGRRIVAAPMKASGPITKATVRCRRDFVIGVTTTGGRLRPDRDWSEEEALFDTVFGKAVAVVDGANFDLGVGGGSAGATVFVFPREADRLVAALHAGTVLGLRFDILPEDAKDGAGFETFARFDITALGSAMTAAGGACAFPW